MIRNGNRLIDDEGRTLIVRGVNLGGSSKVPARPDGATYRRDYFFAHHGVSFVGRPFPLEEADAHLGRIAGWGFSLLRLIVTWEAIEHAGPGLYDEEYLDYIAAVVDRAAAHGLRVLIDPHQDVWSRFSGGDGAPGWTFDAVGLDITRFQQTGAAIVHATHGDPFPRMIWPTNGWKLAAATMFTLFFGGNDFAPGLLVDGQPVQEYLQGHYLRAMQRLAGRLRDRSNVVGYEPMNEPMAGFIGLRDMLSPGGPLAQGERPSAWQAMLLGAGYPQRVGLWQQDIAQRKVGERLVNPAGLRAWLPGHECVWRQAGVWDVDAGGAPRLLRPQHFCYVGGRFVEFGRDYLRPFAARYARAIRAAHPGAPIFVEPAFGAPAPGWAPDDPEGIVYAPHWYDLLTLYVKRYVPGVALNLEARGMVAGPGPVRRHFAAELRELQRQGEALMGGAPTIVGEFGVPFDLNNRHALRSGDFSLPARALQRSLAAMEDALASSIIWNYTPDNSNARGDNWNDEDLSIFSRDQQHSPADPDSGGRALGVLVRPYAMATPGTPLLMRFEPGTRRFRFRFRRDPAVSAPAEIFLPRLQYPQGCRASSATGECRVDLPAQRLFYQPRPGVEIHELVVAPA